MADILPGRLLAPASLWRTLRVRPRPHKSVRLCENGGPTLEFAGKYRI
jgi:hypothetical protein